MAYLYHFELILVGIILLSAMCFAGIKIWLKRKSESKLEEQNTSGKDSNDIF